MATRKNEGGVGITGQIKRSRFSSTAGIVLVFSIYLVFLSTVSFAFYEVENEGTLIYISDSTPTEEEQEVINQWKKVYFVDFHYEGPEKYRDEIKKIFRSCGIFTGGKEPFFVKLYEGFEYLALWMWKNGKSWDNFSSPSTLEDFDLAVKDGLSHFFHCASIPKKSFLVYISENSIRTQIVDFNGRPVTFKRAEQDFYDVFINDEATSMKAGFHKINSSFVFVGKNGQRISSVLFFKNAKMVYPIDGTFAVLEGNLIKFPDGETVVVYEEPLYVGREIVVYRNSIVYRGKSRVVNSTILDTNGEIVLEADGTVEDVEGKWKMKVFGIPVEWYFKSNFLYVLDINGFLRKFDFIKKQVLFEKRYPGAYGFDFYNGKLVIGIPDGVLFNGKKLNMSNFCVAKNQIWEYKNCVRLHNGIGYVQQNGKVEIIGKDFGTFVKKVRLISGWLVFIGDGGVWVVKAGN